MTTTIATRQNLKDYGRIETTAEDALLDELLAEAIGTIESKIGKSLTIESASWYDDAISMRILEGASALQLRYAPVDAATVVVTDNDGQIVSADLYTVRNDRAQVVARGDFRFDNGPYLITCQAGFETSPSYSMRELPSIKALVLKYALFLYQQRTPGASMERAAGTSVDYEIDEETGLPHVIARGIRALRGIVVTG